MSPDSLETRFAELRAEVRGWEHQLRAVAPIVRDVDRIDERLSNTVLALDTLRRDVNERFAALQDEMTKDLQHEVADLQGQLRDVVDRRDKEILDIRKSIGDCGITAASLVREARADLGSDIVELKQNQAAIGADRTNRRGQNITAIVTLAGTVGLLLATVLERILG
jgi:chromosome segregation ATPase